MKIRYLIAVLIISILAFQCYSQRGGGRSRSSSRSRSWGSKSSGSSFFFGSSRTRRYRSGNGTSLWDWLFSDNNSTNTTEPSDHAHYDNSTINGDDWQTSSSTGSSSISWAAWIFGGVIAILAYLGLTSKGLSGQTRVKQIRRVTDEFEQDNECRSSLTDTQRGTLIQQFVQTQWKVQINCGSSPNTFYKWDMKIKNLNKRTEFVYQIEAQGFNDQNGDSKIKGIVLFRDQSMSICFDKLHNDRERAGQTGKWDLLIYEGYLNGRNFEGGWYYHGFRNDGQYSGEMKMSPK